jgi:hypothetical protein
MIICLQYCISETHHRQLLEKIAKTAWARGKLVGIIWQKNGSKTKYEKKMD